MARLPRLYAPGLPHLVLARFIQPLTATTQSSPAALLDPLAGWLGDSAARYRVSIHGWALADDRILLFATPADATGLPRLMQTLGRNLAARMRSGRIFAGRYRSALVQPGVWTLPALIWLETYPQRAGLTQDAESWPWSSAGQHTGAQVSGVNWVSDHADYWSCGNTPFDRQANYRRLLHSGLSASQVSQIDLAVNGQWALGSPDFVASLSHVASRRVAPGKRGRPRKASTTPGAAPADEDKPPVTLVVPPTSSNGSN